MAVLRTRMTLAQIRAENGQSIADANGNKYLEVELANTAESHIAIGQGNTGEGPSVQAKSATVNDLDLSLSGKGGGSVTIMGDAGNHGSLKVVTSAFTGFRLKPSTASASVYNMTAPASLPGAEAFLKIDAAGQIEFSTGSASSFTIKDAASGTQTVQNGDQISFLGTTNEVDVAVSATDNVTIGLPSEVVLTTSLEAPTVKTDAIQDETGVPAINISGNDVTVLGDLTVQGTTVTLNVANLTVEDKLIDIASNAANSAGADGAGIQVTDSAYASLLFDDAQTSWDANVNFNLSTATLSYKIADSVVLDADGARFTESGLGVGIKQDSGLATLDIRSAETDIAAASTFNPGGSYTGGDLKQIDVGTTSIFTPDSFFQVYLNGILQRGVTSSDANANRKVDNGTFDYSYDSADGEVNFSAAQVVDTDLVTIYFTK